FVARDYFEVIATFDCQAGQYQGRWVAPDFKKNDADPELRPERIWQAASADRIVAECQSKPAVVREESKPSSQSAPALFDLTSLQREANARFGFSAKNTLGLAQALYEQVSYDSSTGQPITANLIDYLIPSAPDMPNYTAGRITTLCPNNPLGAKGIGESGAVGSPPAVVNAVINALAPFGVEHIDMPVTPEKVWKAMQKGTRA
ncbi:MAG: hypothetical protein EBX95_12840, partial [Acidimicrobiia bacterium]|nr:hypothetical protein [Acidimicrobiia bacterium]